MTIHKQIRAARLNKGWSMRQLAEAVSRAEGQAKPLAWQTVQQWESGVSAPKRKRMAIVAQLLELVELDGDDAPAQPDDVLKFSRTGPGPSAVPARDTAATSWQVATLSAPERADWIHELWLDAAWAQGNIRSGPSLQGALRLHTVQGDAMAPTCQAGDVLLIDTSVQHLHGEGIYLLQHDHSLLLLRRVRQRLNGTLELVADHPHAAAPEPLDATALGHLRVVGRALWRLRGEKL